MRVLLIANPSVGINKEKKQIIDRISSRITQDGGTVDITYSMKPGFGKKYSQMADVEGYDAVFAAGGDGTVNDVASGLINKKVPLGIIPLGTGNGLARGLNIPLEEKEYTEVLLSDKIRKIDSGKISAHNFFATCGIGFDAHIASDFNKPHRLKRHPFTYFLFGIKNYLFTRPEKVTVIADGREISRKIFALTIANVKEYGSGAIIAPQADPSSGKFIAVLIPKIGIFRALPSVGKLFNGEIEKVGGVEFIECKSIKIKREKRGIYHVDGETYEGDAILNVSISPSSLKVLVP